MFSLLTIISAVGLATAATTPLVQRDTITVTICKGQDLTGNCMFPSIITQNQCLGYSNTEWDNNMQSINVPSGYRCRFWDSNNCNGDSSDDLYGPGTINIRGNMRNKATSFKCYKN
ncbi:hypothetical protein GRF29_44g2724466 [Pseudopithomyces chartarum]|uniref:Uncharacterized protein n=1 Tax=Pseudopithomyces chartarum TaxID=1892770 RepID=A0AAN6M2D2_9PLEO|nr:hypothetical protein GRF29_44g2724466 [Pseudopithomyces chartarum]